MQRRRILAALAATMLCFVAPFTAATAQTSPTGAALVTKTFALSAVGPSPVLSLASGQSNCSVVVQSSTSFSGLTLVPQAASDGPNNPQTWVTAPLIGGGSISTAGAYLGSISSVGLTNFRVYVGAISGGTVTGVIACSTAGGGGSAVSFSNGAIPVFTPLGAGNGAQSSQATLGYNLGWNPLTQNWDGFRLDPADVLEITSGGSQRFDLTSASTSGSCVSLGTGVGRLAKVWNAGPATTVYLTLYDEGASPTCANADRLLGDGATIVVPAGGTILTFDSPLNNGLAYKLSAALSTSQTLHITTFGLGI